MAEKVFVENLDRADPYNFGVISYKIIADHVFTDLGIAGALQSIRILIDIEKPFFYITGILSLIDAPMRVSDIASVSIEDEGIHVVIEDENYAPDLLKLLWSEFGRENITQLDRWNLIIPEGYVTPEELELMVAVNPKDRIMNKILDALNRIIPEGFRVRKSDIEKGRITVIASENPIEPKWIEEARNALESPPVQIPEEHLKKLRQEPKKIEKRVTPWKTHEFQESVK